MVGPYTVYLWRLESKANYKEAEEVHKKFKHIWQLSDIELKGINNLKSWKL